MEIDPSKFYAVISGDFIGFSDLPLKVRKQMYFIVKTGGKQLADAFPGIMPCEVDIFRGDGWQILLTDPVLSLRAALYFRSYIRANTVGVKTDTRMSIAVGKIDYVPENRTSAGDGQAFRLSGRLLDRMGRSKIGSIRFVMENKKSSLALDRIIRQIGVLADNWTPIQAIALTGALQGWTQEQISNHWTGKISDQTLEKHLTQAGWPAIRDGLKAFEEKVAMVIGRN